jgi:uncharacterized iron-regulated membrane protein
MTDTKAKKQAKLLRTFRKIHRLTGAFLFIFFFVIATSGLMLGWKKHSKGIILSKSYKGQSTNPQDWLPLNDLREKALDIARREIPADSVLTIDRIDVRPDKGMAKFLFIEGYWGLQLDLTTGELLHIERRRSDFIENLHDGSILDSLFGIDGGYIKLFYTSIMGVSLLTFTITGFWLWFGPKRLRKTRELEKQTVQ